MPAPKPILVRNIVLSLTFMTALIIISGAIIAFGSAIGLETGTIFMDVVMYFILLTCSLFSLILFGSMVEYFGKEPGLFTMAIAYVFPVIIAYYAELFRDNIHTVITSGVMLLVLLYTLVAESK